MFWSGFLAAGYMKEAAFRAKQIFKEEIQVDR